MSAWTQDFKVFVTNKDADGRIYTLSSPMWIVLLLYVLFLLNAIAWGIVGLVEIVQRIV